MAEKYTFCMFASPAVILVLVFLLAACDANQNVSKSESSDNPSLIALKVPTISKIKDDVSNDRVGYAAGKKIRIRCIFFCIPMGIGLKENSSSSTFFRVNNTAIREDNDAEGHARVVIELTEIVIEKD